jgi:hypothetical protein
VSYCARTPVFPLANFVDLVGKSQNVQILALDASRMQKLAASSEAVCGSMNMMWRAKRGKISLFVVSHQLHG